MDLYEGLILKQTNPILIYNKYLFNMVGAEFKIIELGMNTIRLSCGEVIIEIQDDLIDEYFQPIIKEYDLEFMCKTFADTWNNSSNRRLLNSWSDMPEDVKQEVKTAMSAVIEILK